MPDRIKQDSSFDVLGDILETMRFRSSIFFRSDLAAPWGMSLMEIDSPRFHIALDGECFIGAEHHDAVKVGEMDIIMLPNGGSHWIADKPGREMIASDRAGKACELDEPFFQQGTITNRLMCGIVSYDEGAKHPILGALPEIINFSKLKSNGPIWTLVMLIDAEMGNNHGRGSQITNRLTEALFLQLLNQYVSENQKTTGFLSALSDRRIYRALMMIHSDPSYDWSLSLLGERIGMSRATLVRHFQGAVGVAPMAYINNWRMMKAYNAIKYTSASFEQVATAIGFTSARTLTRAFVRQFELTPSKLRRSQHKSGTDHGL